MKKTIYSLLALREALLTANRCYLKFISEVENPEVGAEKLHQLAETKAENNRYYNGFNLFSEEIALLFRSLLRGEFTISGFTNKNLRQLLSHKNAGKLLVCSNASRFTASSRTLGDATSTISPSSVAKWPCWP